MNLKKEILNTENDNNIIKTENLLIQGRMVKWNGSLIQLENVSLITISNYNTPNFPNWLFWSCLAGFALLTTPLAFLGIIVLVACGFPVYQWVKKHDEALKKKFLNFHLNSGKVFSIMFDDETFLKEVYCILENIISSGNEKQNIYVDIRDSQIINNYENKAVIKELEMLKESAKGQLDIYNQLEKMIEILSTKDKKSFSDIMLENIEETVAQKIVSFLFEKGCSSVLKSVLASIPIFMKFLV